MNKPKTRTHDHTRATGHIGYANGFEYIRKGKEIWRSFRADFLDNFFGEYYRISERRYMTVKEFRKEHCNLFNEQGKQISEEELKEKLS